MSEARRRELRGHARGAATWRRLAPCPPPSAPTPDIRPLGHLCPHPTDGGLLLLPLSPPDLAISIIIVYSFGVDERGRAHDVFLNIYDF